MVSFLNPFLHPDLPLPDSAHLKYLDHIADAIHDVVKTLSFADRQGLLVVSMYPLDAEIDDDYVYAISRDDLSVESIAECGIHREEAEIMIGLIAQGLPDTEMWVLLKEPSCGLTTFSFLPLFVGESFEAQVLQLNLFEESLILTA